MRAILFSILLLAACGDDGDTEPRSCDDFALEIYRVDARGALQCRFDFDDGQDPSRIFPDGYVQQVGYPVMYGKQWITLAWRWDLDSDSPGTAVRVGKDSDNQCQWVRADIDWCSASPSVD